MKPTCSRHSRSHRLSGGGAFTPFVEGSTIAIVGAGDALGEMLCAELVKLGVSKLVVVEDCETRLARISHFLSSVGICPRVSVSALFSPARVAHGMD